MRAGSEVVVVIVVVLVDVAVVVEDVVNTVVVVLGCDIELVVVVLVVVVPLSKVSVKLSPSDWKPEVRAITVLCELTMSICSTADPKEDIVPVVPPIVAVFELPAELNAGPNSSVPKFASGNTPVLLEGASVIHSAELSCALGTDALAVYEVPEETSVRTVV